MNFDLPLSKSLFDEFTTKKILVVGDVMIDSYVWGKVERISPEAPVPVVDVLSQDLRLGGAANVALNVKSLGAEPILCSVIGNDERASQFDELMNKRDFDPRGLVRSEERRTTVKHRIICGGQHMLRIDEEDKHSLTEHEEDRLIASIKAYIQQGVDAIVLEDYNKGVLTPTVIDQVIAAANEAGIPTAVDPKKENFFAYRNATLFKPNLKELKEGLKVDFDKNDIGALRSAVEKLEAEMSSHITLVTLSELGVMVRHSGLQELIPAHKREILDVSGAGDTVISIAALCLASGVNAVDMARLANLGGGLVCEKVGVVPVDVVQLQEEAFKLEV